MIDCLENNLINEWFYHESGSRAFTEKEVKEHERILYEMGTVIKENVFSNIKEENKFCIIDKFFGNSLFNPKKK